MRILFLHEVGYLEKPIYEMHEFPEHLAARGHEVAFADYPETPTKQISPRFGVVIQGRVLSGANLSLYSQKAVFPGIVGRLLAVLLFPFFFQRVLSDFKPDIVVSFAVPTSGWQAAIICKRKKLPLLFRALDVSHKIRRSAFSPLVRSAERFVYRNSTWVSCNNAALRDYCINLGAHEDRSSVELPVLDLVHFRAGKDARQRMRAKLGIADDATVVAYMGSFFYFSGLDQVIRQLGKVADKPQLLLIGGGEQEVELKQLVTRLKLKDYVTFTGFVGFDELPSYLSVADVAINSMLPSEVADLALPNKVLQYMASGLPVVSTDLKGLSSLFHRAEGLSLVSLPEEVLVKSILVAAEANFSRMGAENRKLVDETFERERIITAFEQLLTQVRSSQ